MARPDAPKTITILLPAYRRWMVPEIRELKAQLPPFTQDPKTLVLRMGTDDSETGQTRERLFEVADMDANRQITLPGPDFHSRGFVTLTLEDRKGETELARGRVELTVIKPGDIGARYFDNRDILISSKGAELPWIWQPTLADDKHHDPSSWQNLMRLAKKLGMTSVLHPGAKWSQAELGKLNKWAGDEGLGLIIRPALAESFKDPKSVAKRVRPLRHLKSLVGYWLDAPAKKSETNDDAYLAVYRNVRQTDVTRPVYWQFADTTSDNQVADFDDVFAVPAGKGPDQPGPGPTLRLQGQLSFGVVKLSDKSQDYRTQWAGHLVNGARGFLFDGTLADDHADWAPFVKSAKPVTEMIRKSFEVPAGGPKSPLQAKNDDQRLYRQWVSGRKFLAYLGARAGSKTTEQSLDILPKVTLYGWPALADKALGWRKIADNVDLAQSPGWFITNDPTLMG